MLTVCISVRDRPRSADHFAERGVHPRVFRGIDAARLGLQAPPGFTDDRAGFSAAARVGCWLSHRAVWAACLLTEEQEFFVLEDDARFVADWRERLDAAMAHLPADWDVLYVGSCCAADKRPRRVAGELYEFAGEPGAERYPMCQHAKILRRGALRTLIETTDAVGIRRPLDVTLLTEALPKLRVFGVLPRLADQCDQVLVP